MTNKTEQDFRRVRSALALLDTIASSDTWMPSVEIECLCKARELLADVVGMVYSDTHNRYTNVSRP